MTGMHVTKMFESETTKEWFFST